eukprot:m.317319 g.317319  ORF g.317319 m.317319 type:complete len:143 (-) comp16433_c3_seq3:317-745(-)
MQSHTKGHTNASSIEHRPASASRCGRAGSGRRKGGRIEGMGAPTWFDAVVDALNKRNAVVLGGHDEVEVPEQHVSPVLQRPAIPTTPHPIAQRSQSIFSCQHSFTDPHNFKPTKDIRPGDHKREQGEGSARADRVDLSPAFV